MAVIVSIWVASPVYAFVAVLHFPMVGITMDQTARLNVVNVSDPEDDIGQISPKQGITERPCMAELMFFDDMGDMLGRSMIVELMAGHAAFHDLRGLISSWSPARKTESRSVQW